MELNFAQLWPRAEARRLRRENERLSVALRNATDKAADSQARLDELRNHSCPACEVMKQALNFHVYAAGSKVAMFDGVGPTLPKPEPHTPLTAEQMQQGPMRASRLARQQRTNFLDQFVKSEAQVPVEEFRESEAG